jgi:hypothetical protein
MFERSREVEFLILLAYRLRYGHMKEEGYARVFKGSLLVFE